MPASIKHLTDKKSNLTSLLARWKDGLYYTAAVIRCDKANKRCLVCFEDGSEVWVTNRDVHLQLSLDQLNEEEDIVCCMCDGGSSEPPNEIILCDVCQQGYHQKCHVPPVDSSKIDESEETSDHKDWFCATCSYILNQSDRAKLGANAQQSHSRSQSNPTQASKSPQQPSQSVKSPQNNPTKQTVKRPPPSPKSTQQLEPKAKTKPKDIEPKEQEQPVRQKSPIIQQTQLPATPAITPPSVVKSSPKSPSPAPTLTPTSTSAIPATSPMTIGLVQSQQPTPARSPAKLASKASSSSLTLPSQQNQIKTTVISPLVKSTPATIVTPDSGVTTKPPVPNNNLNNNSNIVVQAKSTPYYPLSNQVRVIATSSTAALASMTASLALVVGSSAGRTKQDIVNQSNRSNQNRQQKGSPGHNESVITSVANSTVISQPPVKNAVRKSSVNFVMPPIRQSALPTATRSVPGIVPTSLSTGKAAALEVPTKPEATSNHSKCSPSGATIVSSVSSVNKSPSSSTISSSEIGSTTTPRDPKANSNINEGVSANDSSSSH